MIQLASGIGPNYTIVARKKTFYFCILQACAQFRIELRMTTKFQFNSWIWIDVKNRI